MGEEDDDSRWHTDMEPKGKGVWSTHTADPGKGPSLAREPVSPEATQHLGTRPPLEKRELNEAS